MKNKPDYLVKHKVKISVCKHPEFSTPYSCNDLAIKPVLAAPTQSQSDRRDEFSDRLQDFWDGRELRAEMEKLENKLWWNDFKFELRYWGTVLIAAILLGLAISKN